MYQVNDLVMYGNDGVYRVEAICTPDIKGINKNKLYYVLNPIYRVGRTYIPVDTKMFMRPIITYEVAQQMIDHIPSIKTNVYNNSNMRMLEDHYKELFQTHNCEDLIQLIKTVYAKKEIAINEGKKTGQIDERYMKKAEDLLYSEFAIALDMPKEDVRNYIEERVKQLEN